MINAFKRQRWTPLSIIAIVLGFAIWWPLGLGVLAYILWGEKADKEFKVQANRFTTRRTSGNAAFDEYKRSTIDRLEEEQEAFTEFMEKLRMARDKEEFDRFMAERGKRDQNPAPGAEAAPASA